MSGDVTRYGSVIGLKTEKLDYYKQLHANAWPEVLEQISNCNIRNYSVFLKQMDDDNYYLFSYFEYTGTDIEADLARMGEDETTRKWWKETDPCQLPLSNRKEGEWWASMEEVFHYE
ncbi:MAG: L-rhamnose mutarotase [Phycisphaerales bacterium]|jgi:L-rhamnose mutarotase|nr:L-rhamnose mutarotase [Phycisphaerales bacterium]